MQKASGQLWIGPAVMACSLGFIKARDNGQGLLPRSTHQGLTSLLQPISSRGHWGQRHCSHQAAGRVTATSSRSVIRLLRLRPSKSPRSCNCWATCQPTVAQSRGGLRVIRSWPTQEPPRPWGRERMAYSVQFRLDCHEVGSSRRAVSAKTQPRVTRVAQQLAADLHRA